jgi:hypothetical protein
MAREHIVVDGSNIATEGRSTPSLAQLEQAVSELKAENQDAEVTVIVDASFAHRIDPSELERFEKGVLEGVYVHPPAGAIGRGDAFLLRVAEKVGATVLSNDSFQEFHGEHPWLFERGRLLGATPVPGIGWIFSPRTPVRGPTSRKAVRDTERERRRVTKAIEEATKEAVSPDAARPRRRQAAGTKGDGASNGAKSAKKTAVASAVNDPLTFISFVAEHPLGAEVEGRVESYTSHGAVVFVAEAQCYLPLGNMADPPPRSAREVVKRGEERTFVVTALDPHRRGVELALPGRAEVSGHPSEETIAAEVRIGKKSAAKKAPGRTATAKKHSPADGTAAKEGGAGGKGKIGAPGGTAPNKEPPPDEERGGEGAAPRRRRPVEKAAQTGKKAAGKETTARRPRAAAKASKKAGEGTASPAEPSKRAGRSGRGAR